MGKRNRDKTTTRHAVLVDPGALALEGTRSSARSGGRERCSDAAPLFHRRFPMLCYTPAMRISGMNLIGLAVMALLSQQPSPSIEVPERTEVVLQAKGDGVQIYICTDAPGGTKWTLKGPDAKLLDASGHVIGTHFAGPTWKLNDGGQVQGELIASKPAPEAGSVPWLLLRAKPGTATGSLAAIAFIRRTETHGGVAPGPGCQSAQDVSKTMAIPYTASYAFYAGK